MSGKNESNQKVWLFDLSEQNLSILKKYESFSNCVSCIHRTGWNACRRSATTLGNPYRPHPTSACARWEIPAIVCQLWLFHQTKAPVFQSCLNCQSRCLDHSECAVRDGHSWAVSMQLSMEMKPHLEHLIPDRSFGLNLKEHCYRRDIFGNNGHFIIYSRLSTAQSNVCCFFRLAV